MERYMILIRSDGTGRLIETDHEDVYLAMDVKSKTEWLQRVLQIAEEQEE